MKDVIIIGGGLIGIDIASRYHNTTKGEETNLYQRSGKDTLKWLDAQNYRGL